MPTVQLADVFTPEIWPHSGQWMVEETKRKSAIIGSGLAVDDGYFAEKLAGGGRTFNVPFYNDLDNTESNIATDDPADEATPQKITSGQDVAVRQERTQGWSSALLAADLSGSDPKKAIESRISNYWAIQYDMNAISLLAGIVDDNIANDGGDFVNDISIEDGNNAAATNLADVFSLNDTRQTMGDAASPGNIIICHSVIRTQLANKNVFDLQAQSDSKVWIDSHTGDTVIVSDEVTKVPGGTSGFKYRTIMAPRGLLKHADVRPMKDFAVHHNQRQGRGRGVDEIWTRRQFCFHVPGIKWTDAAVAEGFPTNAELANPANHDRVYQERKQIPLAVMISNG